MLNEMFSATSNTEAAANARSLAGTAALTTIATNISSEVIKKAEANFEDYKDLIARSKNDHNAMDELINKAYTLSIVDIGFLKELDETTLENMLKSQQSKRSRSKGKVMTMDNYRSMMIGAIGENLIRLATGKAKGSTGYSRANGSLDYTADQITELTNDQEKLRKEIRNVQSKKSIMKSREDFDEKNPRWQELLYAEELLKGLRVETKTVVVDETKNKLAGLFGDKNLSTLTDVELREMLEAAKALVGTSDPNEEQLSADDQPIDPPTVETPVENKRKKH